jgi:hypothetical protein
MSPADIAEMTRLVKPFLKPTDSWVRTAGVAASVPWMPTPDQALRALEAVTAGRMTDIQVLIGKAQVAVTPLAWGDRSFWARTLEDALAECLLHELRSTCPECRERDGHAGSCSFWRGLEEYEVVETSR